MSNLFELLTSNLIELFMIISRPRNLLKLLAICVLMVILWVNYNCVTPLVWGLNTSAIKNFGSCFLYSLFLMAIPAFFGASLSTLFNKTVSQLYGIALIRGISFFCWILLVVFASKMALDVVARNDGYTGYLFNDYQTYNHDLFQAFIPVITSIFALLTAWLAFDKKPRREKVVVETKTVEPAKTHDEAGEK